MRRLTAHLLIAVALLGGAAAPLTSQERQHKCPTTAVEGRVILDQETAGKSGAKAFEHLLPKFKSHCNAPGLHLTLVAEVLVDEAGAVECVELLKAVPEGSPYEADFCEVLKKWRFTPIMK